MANADRLEPRRRADNAEARAEVLTTAAIEPQQARETLEAAIAVAEIRAWQVEAKTQRLAQLAEECKEAVDRLVAAEVESMTQRRPWRRFR